MLVLHITPEEAEAIQTMINMTRNRLNQKSLTPSGERALLRLEDIEDKLKSAARYDRMMNPQQYPADSVR